MSDSDGYLYVIVDRVSHTRFSNWIPAKNDLVAIFGFTGFIKELKDNTHPECYALYRVGTTASDGRISDPEYSLIVYGNQAEEKYGDLLAKALEEENS